MTGVSNWAPLQLCVTMSLALVSISVGSDDRESVVIGTALGEIRGHISHDKDGITSTQFLGVPYAQAPIGDLRFAAPKNHQGWLGNTTLDATEYGNMCIGDTSSWDHWFPEPTLKDRIKHSRVDEDCLYLNIYIPRNLSSVQPRSLSLSVMVYIHAGAFTTGSPMLTGGARLASEGDVIVVGINYRLGVFGFLSTGDAASRGNYGLLDQVKALEWVNSNIADYGGNPKSLTIFGASAGGVSVSYHIISPMSKGLFTRAISQSGVAINYYFQRKPKAAVRSLAESVGCTTEPSLETVKCLKKLSAQDLRTAVKVLETKDIVFLPVIDGHFLKESPETLLKRGPINNVDYIIGVASDEGYFYQRYLLNFDLNEGTSEETFEKSLKTYIQSKPGFSQNLEQVLAAFKLEYAFCANPSDRSKALVNIFGDLEFIAPSVQVADIYSHRSQKNTYFYEFFHRPSFGRSFFTDTQYAQRPASVKANHLDDLQFLFGHVKYILPNSTSEEVRLSENMMGIWSNFAKTGNPNPILHGDGVLWKPYTQEAAYYLQITDKLTNQSLKKDLKPRRMAFWKYYLPRLKVAKRCAKSGLCGLQEKEVETYKHILFGAVAGCVILAVLVALLVTKLMVQRCWNEQMLDDEMELEKLRGT